MIPGCQATRIWTVVRHGSRNPNRKTIKMIPTIMRIRDEIVENQQTRQTMCDHDLDLFRQWDSPLSEDAQKDLVMEGIDELIELAERMQNRFPNVLSDIFSNATYRVCY